MTDCCYSYSTQVHDPYNSRQCWRHRVYGACRCSGAQVKFVFGGYMAARQQIVCSQCDKPEPSCICEKYCAICKGQDNVRLGMDGLYYCPECREACDVALANDQ